MWFFRKHKKKAGAEVPDAEHESVPDAERESVSGQAVKPASEQPGQAMEEIARTDTFRPREKDSPVLRQRTVQFGDLGRGIAVNLRLILKDGKIVHLFIQKPLSCLINNPHRLA